MDPARLLRLRALVEDHTLPGSFLDTTVVEVEPDEFWAFAYEQDEHTGETAEPLVLGPFTTRERAMQKAKREFPGLRRTIGFIPHTEVGSNAAYYARVIVAAERGGRRIS